jgi:hypothetical protein
MFRAGTRYFLRLACIVYFTPSLSPSCFSANSRSEISIRLLGVLGAGVSAQFTSGTFPSIQSERVSHATPRYSGLQVRTVLNSYGVPGYWNPKPVRHGEVWFMSRPFSLSLRYWPTYPR